MTRREVIEKETLNHLTDWCNRLVEQTKEYMDSIIPRYVSGMRVRYDCDTAPNLYGLPMIGLYIMSNKTADHDVVFGCRDNISFRPADRYSIIDDQLAFDYYKTLLENKVDHMFFNYCRQIRRYDKEQEENDGNSV